MRRAGKGVRQRRRPLVAQDCDQGRLTATPASLHAVSGSLEDRSTDAVVELVADREPDVRLAAVGGERVRRAADVRPDEDFAVKIGGGELLEREGRAPRSDPPPCLSPRCRAERSIRRTRPKVVVALSPLAL